MLELVEKGREIKVLDVRSTLDQGFMHIMSKIWLRYYKNKSSIGYPGCYLNKLS